MGALGFPAAAAEGDDARNDAEGEEHQARDPGAARGLVLDLASPADGACAGREGLRSHHHLSWLA